MFRPYTVECQYDSEFKGKNQPCAVATTYHPTQLKNYEKIKKFANNRYKFIITYKFYVITYNSIKDMTPLFYTKYIPKPVFITKILQIFDKTPEKDWACPTNCSTAVCQYRNTNPLTRY